MTKRKRWGALLVQSNPLALPGDSNDPLSWSSYQETLSSVHDRHVTGYNPQAKKLQQLAARKKKKCLDWPLINRDLISLHRPSLSPVRRLVQPHKPKSNHTLKWTGCWRLRPPLSLSYDNGRRTCVAILRQAIYC